MISVLFMIPTLDRGGAENVLVDLVNNMDQSKFKITVQTLFDQNSQKDRLKEGIEYRSWLYHQFHGNSRLLARIPAKILYRHIVRKRYDIVISYLEGPTTHIIAGCPYSDSRKVVWIHVEMDKERQALVGFRSIEAACHAYHKFDRIVFVAKTVKDSFQRIMCQNYYNSIVLYNTVDSDLILKKSKDKLKSILLSENEFNIVSIGRVIDAKGYDRLAVIQKRLIDSGYRTHVYILGEGKRQKEIEAYAAEKDIASTFTFLGFQDNPYPFVAEGDLFVCSSRREGFSTAVTEALILGVPVVSTECSGAYELLGENNEYGIVTKNSENALYEGIKRLLDDQELYSYYRRQSKERGKTFAKEKTVKAVEEMLEELWIK